MQIEQSQADHTVAVTEVWTEDIAASCLMSFGPVVLPPCEPVSVEVALAELGHFQSTWTEDIAADTDPSAAPQSMTGRMLRPAWLVALVTIVSRLWVMLLATFGNVA